MRLRRPLFEPAPVKRRRDEGRPLRVMTVAQDAHDAMAALRLVGPNALLARRGLIAWRLAPWSGDQGGLFWDPEAKTAADVYVLPRNIAHAAGRAVIAFAKANGATALFDVDHFLVAPPAGGPEEAAFGACRSQMEDLALRSHGLIVPTGIKGAYGRGPVFEDILRSFNELLQGPAAGDAAASRTAGSSRRSTTATTRRAKTSSSATSPMA